MSTKQKIDQMIVDLYEFANSDALVLREFIKKQKLSYERFTKLLLDNPELKEAFEYARLCVGIRREELAMRNKLNTKIISDSMPLYDDERKAWEETKLKLAKTEAKIGAEVIRGIMQQVCDE